MHKLTNSMIDAIKIIYNTSSTDGINKKTLLSLTNKNILRDNFLSEEAKQFIISKMKLKEQCKELSISFSEITLQYDKNPEFALLEYFNKLGYIGSFSEGHLLLNVLKALVLNKLEEYNIFQSREDACVRFLSAQLETNKNYHKEIISSLENIDKETFIKNLNDIFSHPLIQKFHPNLSYETAVELFDSFDLDLFQVILQTIAENPSEFSIGWPDLLLIKDKQVYFIEVKTTDKLHMSQIKTISLFKNIIPSKFEVIKIIRDK
jgi:hypothetical protein